MLAADNKTAPPVPVCERAHAPPRSPRVCVTPVVTDARLFACGRCGSGAQVGRRGLRSRRVGSARFPLRRWLGAAVRRRRRRLSGCADMRAKRICIPRAYVCARVSRTGLGAENEKLQRGRRHGYTPSAKKTTLACIPESIEVWVEAPPLQPGT